MPTLSEILDEFDHTPKTSIVLLTVHVIELTAVKFYDELQALNFGQRCVIRKNVNIMKKIITHGDFLKISLMFTFIYPRDYDRFRLDIYHKIQKHKSRVGPRIFNNPTGYTLDTEMSSIDLMKWYTCVFGVRYRNTQRNIED